MSKPTAEQPRRLRCAIYTRKSSEEGLDQEYNSLDAQRDAAEAYISSQKHEGWMMVPEFYDDGGFSGGNLERPALKRLQRNGGCRASGYSPHDHVQPLEKAQKVYGGT